eukprot:10657867-Lingulodinium_polyedra.AAC.1
MANGRRLGDGWQTATGRAGGWRRRAAGRRRAPSGEDKLQRRYTLLSQCTFVRTSWRRLFAQTHE